MGIYTVTQTNNRIARNGIFAGLALILFIFESLLPRPFPWMKPGLANIVALYVLLNYRFSDALLVNVARIIVGSLLLGKLFNPSFILAICAGSLAVVAMELARPSGLGPLGLSLIGALFHNFTQLYLAGFFYIDWSIVPLLAPLFLLNAIITGAITGIILIYLMKYLPGTYFIPRTNYGFRNQ